MRLGCLKTLASLGLNTQGRVSLEDLRAENDRVPCMPELICYLPPTKGWDKVLGPSLLHAIPRSHSILRGAVLGFILNHTPSIAPGASGSVQLK